MRLCVLIPAFCLVLAFAGADDRVDGDVVDLMRLLRTDSDDYKLLKELLMDENMSRGDRMEKLNTILLKQTREVQEVYDMKMTYEDEVEYLRAQENEEHLQMAGAGERKYDEQMKKLKNEISITVAQYKEQKKRLKKLLMKDSKMKGN